MSLERILIPAKEYFKLQHLFKLSANTRHWLREVYEFYPTKSDANYMIFRPYLDNVTFTGFVEVGETINCSFKVQPLRIKKQSGRNYRWVSLKLSPQTIAGLKALSLASKVSIEDTISSAIREERARCRKREQLYKKVREISPLLEELYNK